PEVAGTILIPPGPFITVPARSISPLTTCDRLKRGCSPSSTSTFARLRSASSSMTLRQRCPSATAMFAATFVLPTPPLPLVTATTFTGLRSNARSTETFWESSRTGHAHVRVVLGHGALVHPGLGALQALHGLVDEPQPFLVG